jgi:hypothetical protein
MRKLLTAAALLLLSGLVAAAEVTLVSFDREKKEVKVKEGDDEKTYRITDRTKFFAVDQNKVSKELSYDDALKGLGNPKSEGKLKFEIAAKDGELVEAKLKARVKN